MPTITILYFAAIRTHLALERETIPLPLPPSAGADADATISDLPALIHRLHPSAKLQQMLGSCAWCVDEEMVDLEEEGGRVLRGGEVVAVIPPVSGG